MTLRVGDVGVEGKGGRGNRCGSWAVTGLGAVIRGAPRRGGGRRSRGWCGEVCAGGGGTTRETPELATMAAARGRGRHGFPPWAPRRCGLFRVQPFRWTVGAAGIGCRRKPELRPEEQAARRPVPSRLDGARPPGRGVRRGPLGAGRDEGRAASGFADSIAPGGELAIVIEGTCEDWPGGREP